MRIPTVQKEKIKQQYKGETSFIYSSQDGRLSNRVMELTDRTLTQTK
jgi:3-phenylpropionate/cinnamic acid dioxygenase small subunit